MSCHRRKPLQGPLGIPINALLVPLGVDFMGRDIFWGISSGNLLHSAYSYWKLHICWWFSAMLVYQRVSWPGTHGNFAARQMAIVRGIGAMLGNVIILGHGELGNQSLVGGLEYALWLSHHLGNGIIIPTDEKLTNSYIFQRGRYTTNQVILIFFSGLIGAMTSLAGGGFMVDWDRLWSFHHRKHFVSWKNLHLTINIHKLGHLYHRV